MTAFPRKTVETRSSMLLILFNQSKCKWNPYCACYFLILDLATILPPRRFCCSLLNGCYITSNTHPPIFTLLSEYSLCFLTFNEIWVFPEKTWHSYQRLWLLTSIQPMYLRTRGQGWCLPSLLLPSLLLHYLVKTLSTWGFFHLSLLPSTLLLAHPHTPTYPVISLPSI